MVLTECPSTIRSTVLEITATGAAVLTALVPSTDYTVKVIYVDVIEAVVEQITTAITSIVTETLTTIQADTVSHALTTTRSSAARPTIVTLDSVTFLLEYHISRDGSVLEDIRDRQAESPSELSTGFLTCLAQCAREASCVAALFDGSTSTCRLSSGLKLRAEAMLWATSLPASSPGRRSRQVLRQRLLPH
jgi:hypothetical protein